MFQAQDKLLLKYISKTETKGKIYSKSNKRKCNLDYNYTDLPLFSNGREIKKISAKQKMPDNVITLEI